ncbi:MAG: HAD-IIIA family hydrolase, partial [Methylococcaceae bacterium]|nr:HAD-IIIA family hydrolase [Methylococcaceae bacterium]
LSLAEAMTTLFPEADESAVERLMAAYHRYYDPKPIDAGGLFSGVPTLLETLRDKGYKLAVATGKNRKGLDHVLHATGTADLFHATRSAEETASKPHPAMLRQLMTELDTPVQRTLMIGDSVHDLQMARNAGVEAVGVYCGANTKEELQAMAPLLALEETLELMGLLV